MPSVVILALLRVQVPLLSVKPIHSHCDDDHPMGTWEQIIPMHLGDEAPMQPTVPLQKQDRPDISLDTAGFHQFSTRQFCPIYFWSLLTMIICFLVSGFHIPVSRRDQRISEQKSAFPAEKGCSVVCVCWWETRKKEDGIWSTRDLPGKDGTGRKKWASTSVKRCDQRCLHPSLPKDERGTAFSAKSLSFPRRQ